MRRKSRARVVEPVDTRDLKSLGLSRAGSTPAPGTTMFTCAFILEGCTEGAIMAEIASKMWLCSEATDFAIVLAKWYIFHRAYMLA